MFSDEFIRKLKRGEIPLRCEIENTGGTMSPSEMKVSGASVIIDGNETVLLNEEVHLSVGMEAGAKAIFSIPTATPSMGDVITNGSGRVTPITQRSLPEIKLPDGKRKLNAQNETTHFGHLKVQAQRNESNEEHIHVFFGDKHKEKDKTTKHAHIRFGIDGSGRYFRCEDESFECRAEFNDSRVIPKEVTVRNVAAGIKVVVKFNFDQSANVLWIDNFSFA